MNLLNMFDNIEIKNTTRLTGEDLHFCELQDKIYNNAYESTYKLQETIKKLNENEIKELNTNYQRSSKTYVHYHTNATTYGFNKYDFEKLFNNLNDNLVSGIVYYFENKYSLELDYEKIKKSAKDKRINYNFIIDIIFEELGGFSFIDKANQQVKDKLKDKTKQYAREKQKVQVKNNKVIIDSFVREDSWTANEISYNYREELGILFNAINMFCNNEQSSEYIDELSNIRQMKEYDLNFSICSSIKIFKNGRIDIKFSNGNNALAFAKEYTSYSIN